LSQTIIKMINTIIIEDEINVREALKKMLSIIAPEIYIVAETAYVSKAIDLIQLHKPNLIFLDIELEDGTGFDILNQLEKINFNIIFTTAYNQHAIKAFKFSAIDYLLKPIDPLDLENAIKRVTENIVNTKEHQELLKVLQNNTDKKEPQIVLKTTEQRYIFKTKDIIRLEADGAYTLFVTQNNQIIVSKNIKFYQNILDENFIRIHQSHLINKKHVKGVKGYNIILSNNDIVPISTRKKTDIIKLINE